MRYIVTVRGVLRRHLHIINLFVPPLCVDAMDPVEAPVCGEGLVNGVEAAIVPKMSNFGHL